MKIFIDFNKKNVSLSKKLTIIGSLILTLAFVVQNYWLSKWEDKLNDYKQTNEDFTQLTQTALILQTLYFTINSEDSLLMKKQKELYMKTSAEKYRIGKMISTNLDLIEDRNDFIKNTNILLNSIEHEVIDFYTLNLFIQKANELLPEKRVEINEWFSEHYDKKENASTMFLLLQIIGSIILAWGIRYQ